MRTAQWLQEQLAKYPADALCTPVTVDGELEGILVQSVSAQGVHTGFIHCSTTSELLSGAARH
jgi:hypothetical protein